MTPKYEQLLKTFKENEARLSDPAVIGDPKKLQEVSQAFSDQKPAAEKIMELQKVEQDLASARDMLANEQDAEMKAMAEEEAKRIRAGKRIARKRTRRADPTYGPNG